MTFKRFIHSSRFNACLTILVFLILTASCTGEPSSVYETPTPERTKASTTATESILPSLSVSPSPTPEPPTATPLPETPSPSPTAPAESTAGNDNVPLSYEESVELIRSLTDEEWEYFKEIALLSEFDSDDEIIKKWNKTIDIYIGEGYTDDDMTVILEHLSLITSIRGVPEVNIVRTSLAANVTIDFITQAEMNELTKEYGEISSGLATIYMNDSYEITYGEIRIVADEQSQNDRNNTLIEEITHIFGLINDSDKYVDSIFYVYYTGMENGLSELDIKLINVLYSSAVTAGMRVDELEALRGL